MKKTSGKKTTYSGHRKRIKEKYLRTGLDGWQDYEVLEFALSYAIPRMDTKPIAKKMISEFKTFNAVLDAGRKELSEIGISEHTVAFLKFLKDTAILYSRQGLEGKDLISSPELVFDYLKVSLKGAFDEELKILFLNSRNQLISVESLESGTVDRSVVYPRKVVEKALESHAVSVIIAHNHPSGALQPSQDDREVTQSISKALNTVDITLLDHVIIGDNDYFSFKSNGLEI